MVADQQGKEFTVLRSDIEERNKTSNSLMPANVNEILQPDEFRDLIGYLSSLRAKVEGQEKVESRGLRGEGQKKVEGQGLRVKARRRKIDFWRTFHWNLWLNFLSSCT